MYKYDEWFGSLYAQEYNQMCILCKKLLPQTSTATSAEDLAQEVFVILYQNRVCLYRHPNINGWLRVTARYISWHTLRDIHCETLLIRELCSGTAQSRSDPLTALMECGEVSPLDALDIDDIELMYLHYVDGVPLAQLAADRNTSVAAIKMRLYRLRQKIKDAR